MAITIKTDSHNRIWRYDDGIPTRELFICTPAEAEHLGLIRYSAAYPGERWDAPGPGVRPEQVSSLYCLPMRDSGLALPSREEQSKQLYTEEGSACEA